MRPWIRWIGLAIVLVVILAFGLRLFGASSSTKLRDDVIVILALMTSLATAAYAFFAYHQWKTIKRQADHMESQLGVLNRTADATSTTADAARLSAESLLALETPHVLLLFEAAHPQHTIPFNEITLETHNFGRTPVFVTDVCIRFEVAKELPTVPSYITGDRPEDHRRPQIPHVVLPTKSHPEPYPDLEKVWPREVQLAPDREGPQCWAIGYVEYVDLFDRKRRKGFCVRRLSHTNAVDWVHQSVRPAYVYLKECDGKDWKDVRPP